MRVLKPSVLALCVGFLVLSVPLAGKADEWNKKTIMTFNAPIEVPGMVLAPGTYVFKLADTPFDRNIVQVFNKDESHIYDTFMTASAYRLEPTDKTVVTFEESAKGTPEAIHDWFYPGDNYGQEFLYHHSKQPEMAMVASQNTSTMEKPSLPALALAATVPAPEPAMTPAPSNPPTEMAEVVPSPQPVALAPAPAPMPKKLPKTASPLPILLLTGLLCLAGSAGLQVFAKRSV